MHASTIATVGIGLTAGVALGTWSVLSDRTERDHSARNPDEWKAPAKAYLDSASETLGFDVRTGAANDLARSRELSRYVSYHPLPRGIDVEGFNAEVGGRRSEGDGVPYSNVTQIQMRSDTPDPRSGSTIRWSAGLGGVALLGSAMVLAQWSERGSRLVPIAGLAGAGLLGGLTAGVLATKLIAQD